MKSPLLVRLISVSILTLACTDPSGPAQEEELAFVELATLFDLRAERREVIRSQDRFEEVWATLNQYSDSTPPVVDFDTQFVLVVAVGGRPTGGYGVSIERVRKLEDRLVVDVVESLPAKGACRHTQGITWPATIVASQRARLPVEFTYTLRESHCYER